MFDSLYNGKISEEDFNRLLIQAESKVRSVIGPIKYATITEETFGFGILQETIMNVITKLDFYEKSGAGKGLTSVSNDGYSESYSQTTAEDLEEDIRSSIIEMLSGTGLVGAY